MPLVKSMLYHALGVQPRTELDPKAVVALGGLGGVPYRGPLGAIEPVTMSVATKRQP